MKYTLQSLKAQTNQKFVALISYDEKTKHLVKEALGQYEKLPKNVKFIKAREYNHCVEKYTKGYQDLYLVRIDSDDMYHSSFVQQLHDYQPKPDTQILICQNGYIFDTVNQRLAACFRSSPPFYTVIYRVDDYLKGERYGFSGNHTKAIKLRHESLNNNNYIIVAHSSNTSTSFARYVNKIKHEINEESKKLSILSEFMGKQDKDK